MDLNRSLDAPQIIDLSQFEDHKRIKNNSEAKQNEIIGNPYLEQELIDNPAFTSTTGLSRIELLLKNGTNVHQPITSKLVEVEFKGNRKELFNNEQNIPLRLAQKVVVEEEDGIEVGSVYSLGKHAESKLSKCGKEKGPKKKLLRTANVKEIERYRENILESEKVVKLTKKLVNLHNLEMKVTDAEWQFDRQRVTIFFTAPARVDFRELVKDLAKEFKTRIELRQISSREETKRLGCDVGPCGRELCCTTFLKTFDHVTLDHAKTQQLANNVSKLSGNCGRLKCCLKYEYDTYVAAFENYPPLNSVIETEKGIAQIMKVDIFKDLLTLYFDGDHSYDTITLEQLNYYAEKKKVFTPKEAYNGNSFLDIRNGNFNIKNYEYLNEEDSDISTLLDETIIEDKKKHHKHQSKSNNNNYKKNEKNSVS